MKGLMTLLEVHIMWLRKFFIDLTIQRSIGIYTIGLTILVFILQISRSEIEKINNVSTFDQTNQICRSILIFITLEEDTITMLLRRYSEI